MSYSYVKTVFPEFQYSNVYNSKIYDNLNVSKDQKVFEAADLQNLHSNFSDLSVFEEEKPSKSKIETLEIKLQVSEGNNKALNQTIIEQNNSINIF